MIPTVEDLRSDPLIHKFGDCFNPPGLTNFIGTIQTDIDITGIRSVNLPPFSCADTVTAGLYINGKYFPATGSSVTFVWYPDRLERSAACQGLALKSTTVMAPGIRAAMIRMSVKNESGTQQEVALRFGLQGNVTRSARPWNTPLPECEHDNRIDIDQRRSALLYLARHSRACLIQGIHPAANTLDRSGLSVLLQLSPEEEQHLTLVIAVGETRGEVQGLYDRLINRPEQLLQSVRKEWNAELRAVFTPANDRYSGWMPTLHTRDADILKIYRTGILGVIYFKRDNPLSTYGRAYDTLMPKYWQTVTFLWDYHLSSLVHSLLDPEVMRKYLQHWMQLDIHRHFGTEYLSGGPAGNWYSVNDYAMTRMIYDYLKWSGNHGWLQKEIPGKEASINRVIEYLERYVNNWKQFKTASGLADYGGINNLLECVSSYIHEVASLNAANVFNMRSAAEIFAMLGDRQKSARLNQEAGALVKTLQQLYVEGKGYWNTRFPDGRLVEVRHCYDFITILNTISDDLTERQKAEMADFFVRELQTPTWMHALSPGDHNALFSVRPDHQWNGAYPAWPPQAVTGLYRIGKVDLAYRWLKGLAKTANQGPYGQAHFAESVVDPDQGGARKAPADMPYITDWLCSSNGSWVNTVIEAIFGVRATLDQGISAEPQFGPFDPGAELHDLHYQGKRYHVTRKGLQSAG